MATAEGLRQDRPPVEGERPPAAFLVLLVVVVVLAGVRLAGESSVGAGLFGGLAEAPQASLPGPVRPIEPATIAIPAIGVEAPVIRLGLDAEGALEVPDDTAVTGWWAGGSPPGAPGPAVIVGHLDSYTGPGVFHRLRDLAPGDVVEVRAAGGEVVRFTVQRLETHSKDAFPTEAVYGPTGGPELRLVTCGGRFDRRTGHYEENVIAFATLA